MFLLTVSALVVRSFRFDGYNITVLILIPMVLASVLSIIWGYSIKDGILIIHRLAWKTRIPLAGLVAFWRDPSLTSKDIPSWTNTPYCSATVFSRRPSCPKLGKYDAFLNGHKNAIVLAFPSRRIVISPSNPEAFAAALQQTVPTAS
ncbi:pH domain-containing protein [Terrimicrobium sacchariphilum]|uniref:pH domain-containing protein n=1 Tax=Terrimicrobium sacchariphilum TaxID=690879 RepID=A0A146GA45_TERSA|nr:PH domain-containing protein [Terrimicrobium sacchariphilum]GAT34519.1 pH domain-containing protein [Terrimicrobium sacchariphilum]